MKSLFKSATRRYCMLAVLFLASVGIIVVYETDLYNVVPLVQDTLYLTSNERIPKPLVGLIRSLDDLEGRHSDSISGRCQDSTDIQARKQNYPFLGPFKYLSNYKNPCWISPGTKRLRCVPYFHLIGAAKAGSTDLFKRLQLHPQIHPGQRKEARWFGRRRFNNSDMPTFDHYLNFFDNAVRGVNRKTLKGSSYHADVVGEGSPTYYYSSQYWKYYPGNEGCTEPRITVMSYIHHLWPQAKLIMILRNPTTRVYSAYLYNTHIPGYNRSTAQFHERITNAHNRWQECLQRNSFRHCMYDMKLIFTSQLPVFYSGLYSRYILDVLKIFPRKQIFFVNMEHYSNNKAQYMKEIFEFLDLDPLPDKEINKIVSGKQQNKGKNYKKAGAMMEKSRILLDNFYAPFNRELAAILNDTRYLWLDP